jgi:hypothetical protein
MGGQVGAAGCRRPPPCGVGASHAPNNDRNPWRQQPWVLPPHAQAEWIWARADVLAVYTRPDDPQRPPGCSDATSTPLGADTRRPIPAAPGPPERGDDEDERQGTAQRCMVCAPVAGQRRVTVPARRTAGDFAPRLRQVVAEPDPQAETSVLVRDHLHTHQPASVSEAFPPAEARRLRARVASHDTPKPGRWLEMAETDLRVLARPCVHRRIPDPNLRRRDVAAWERQRKAAECRVDWRVTTENARSKRKRLYPSIQHC